MARSRNLYLCPCAAAFLALLAGCVGAGTDAGITARKELEARGFRQVCALTGGMSGWSGPVVR